MEGVRVEHPAGGHRGVFGPASLTWRLHTDPLLGMACLRSLLLRALHPPGLAANAAAHDGENLWDRLARTLRYVGVVTYGSSVEAATAAARARALHAQIEAYGPGGRFRGDDRGPLLWLHCCQVSSFLEVVRRGGLVLTPAEQNAYLTEQVRTAAMWGLEPEDVPNSTGELARCLRDARPELSVTPEARRFAAAVIAPPLPEVILLPDRRRPPWAAVSGLAFAALPPWARQMYGFRYLSGPASLGQAATTVALHSLRASLYRRPSEPSRGRPG